MPYQVTLESTLREDFGHACQLLVYGIRGAVDKACEEGADEARRTHLYKDRTGTLTKSIGDRLTSIGALGAEGVIEATAPYAKFVEGGTKPHHIVPRRARMLAWEGEGGQGDWHFARSVQHPGTQPLPFMGPAYLKAERVLEREVWLAAERAQAAFER
jgi:hypothetical protein